MKYEIPPELVVAHSTASREGKLKGFLRKHCVSLAQVSSELGLNKREAQWLKTREAFIGRFVINKANHFFPKHFLVDGSKVGYAIAIPRFIESDSKIPIHHEDLAPISKRLNVMQGSLNAKLNGQPEPFPFGIKLGSNCFYPEKMGGLPNHEFITRWLKNHGVELKDLAKKEPSERKRISRFEELEDWKEKRVKQSKPEDKEEKPAKQPTPKLKPQNPLPEKGHYLLHELAVGNLNGTAVIQLLEDNGIRVSKTMKTADGMEIPAFSKSGVRADGRLVVDIRHEANLIQQRKHKE